MNTSEKLGKTLDNTKDILINLEVILPRVSAKFHEEIKKNHEFSKNSDGYRDYLIITNLLLILHKQFNDLNYIFLEITNLYPNRLNTIFERHKEDIKTNLDLVNSYKQFNSHFNFSNDDSIYKEIYSLVDFNLSSTDIEIEVLLHQLDIISNLNVEINSLLESYFDEKIFKKRMEIIFKLGDIVLDFIPFIGPISSFGTKILKLKDDEDFKKLTEGKEVEKKLEYEKTVLYYVLYIFEGILLFNENTKNMITLNNNSILKTQSEVENEIFSRVERRIENV